MGAGLAEFRSLQVKHAIKQVDRLLSNMKVCVEDLTCQWVAFAIRGRGEIWVNVDWTDFDDDNQTTLVLSLQLGRGRALPLVWKTEWKTQLKNRKFACLEAILRRLRRAVPEGVDVWIVGDREFGAVNVYELLGELRFDYVLRFRGNIYVRDWKGTKQRASEWGNATGRARSLIGARVTDAEYRVGKVIVLRDKNMKDQWCLAISRETVSASVAKRRYGLRFECEETFRDFKDDRFGFGMSQSRISRPDRRDWLFLLAALAHAMLVLLGRAGERVGLDRTLKANTSKKRQHSLQRQGLMWFRLIPRMPEERLLLLLEGVALVSEEEPLMRTLLAGEAK
ncbi:MAG TPA: IS4 family transposase [Roseibacterium sp.]|nr:IS4 family transposase [Roseibacterium sp.]